MAHNISLLPNEIDKILKTYSSEVKEDIKKSANTVTDELVSNLKAVTKPYKTGKYSKSWAKKEYYGGYLVYNKKYYMLTHLLEYGHAKRGGGRVQGIKHIQPLEEKANDKFTKEIERVLSK